MVFLFVGSSALTGSFLPTEPRDSAVAQVESLGHAVAGYERQPDCVPTEGTFTASAYPHVRRTPSGGANGWPESPFAIRKLLPGRASLASTVGHGQMKFRMSIFVDAFLGSGVPLAGDPITSFQNVSLLGLRTATVLDNCNPMVGDVVKVRFISTNCGEGRLEIVPPGQDGRQRDPEPSENSVVTLLPGESLEYSVFRSWDAPGEHQLTLAYEARCAGQPFARLAYPTVAIHVRPLEANKFIHWILWARAAHPQAQ
jgi:hypothetical protein